MRPLYGLISPNEFFQGKATLQLSSLLQGSAADDDAEDAPGGVQFGCLQSISETDVGVSKRHRPLALA